MNKIKWLTFLTVTLLTSFELLAIDYAIDKNEVIIALFVNNIRGIEVKKDIVMINNNKVIVNKEKLSPIEIITQSKNIAHINHFLPTARKLQCGGGTFKHVYLKGKIKKIESGCIESARYTILAKSFKALKKDSITE